MDRRPKPSGIGDIIQMEGFYISEIPLPLQVNVGALCDNLKVGDIVQISGTGWQADIGAPLRIPESQKWEIVCPDLIPEGAD